MPESICKIVRQREQEYIAGTSALSKYVTHSLYETVSTIDAYLNSVHISGKFDSLNREKPFFNIVVAAANIWFRATYIEKRKVRIKATKQSQYAAAFLATVHLHEWMNKARFGAFLNTWGLTLARYGSAVTKFVEIDGVLYPRVIPWNRLIVDSVDFKNNPKIEKLYYTPAQLRRAVKEQGYDKASVEALIAAHAEGHRTTLDKQQQDNLSGYIELYEIHGEFPLNFITGNEKDEDTDRQQMHVVSFVETTKGEYDDFTLYKGKEKKDPYVIAHLLEADGRTLAIGAVEYCFDAQWMKNHTAKAIKDQLDVASKLVLQTADKNFAARNILDAIETGDILVYEDGKPLTQANTGSHDITSLQSFGAEWSALSQDITSTPEAMRGITGGGVTAYRQAALAVQQSSSLFEKMTENKKYAIEDMAREFIIPHIKTKLDTNAEVAATLESEDIQQLDSWYIPNEAIRRGNKKFKDALLSGKQSDPIPASPNYAAEQQQLQEHAASLGNQRFFVPSREFSNITWKEVFKDLEWNADVAVTADDSNNQEIMSILASVFQTIATNPDVLQNKNAQLVFTRILEEAGELSPIQFTTATSAPQPQPAPQPMPQPQPQPPQGASALQGIGLKQ